MGAQIGCIVCFILSPCPDPPAKNASRLVEQGPGGWHPFEQDVFNVPTIDSRSLFTFTFTDAARGARERECTLHVLIEIDICLR